jgi:molybdate transport system substrate-binding protein
MGADRTQRRHQGGELIPQFAMATLHVLSAGAAKGLVTALAGSFERDSGHVLRAEFGAVGAMLERFDAGDPCDLIILSRAMIDELARAGRVDESTVAALGRVRTGVAALPVAARPSVASADALRSALRAASAVYFPDPQRATAGIHFMKVLTALGLVDEVAPRLRPFANGATAMAEMARAADPASIGVTQVTEILYTPGVTLIAPLPPEFELATVYSAAVVAGCAQRAGAVELLQRLTGSAAAVLRRDGGFEPC